jgi:hypothetical protein
MTNEIIKKEMTQNLQLVGNNDPAPLDLSVPAPVINAVHRNLLQNDIIVGNDANIEMLLIKTIPETKISIFELSSLVPILSFFGTGILKLFFDGKFDPFTTGLMVYNGCVIFGMSMVAYKNYKESKECINFLTKDEIIKKIMKFLKSKK